MSKLMTLLIAMVFAVSAVSLAFAASVTCTVDSVDGQSVVLDCGKKADKLKVGNTVKVKIAAKKAIEGH